MSAADLITFAVACLVAPIYLLVYMVHAERARLRRYGLGAKRMGVCRQW